MPSKSASRRKHVPQRTCVGCRQVLAKRALIRVVRGPEGVRVDPGGKAPGRGAYLHDQRSCWKVGLRGALGHALRTDLSPEARAALMEFADSLPDVDDD